MSSQSKLVRRIFFALCVLIPVIVLIPFNSTTMQSVPAYSNSPFEILEEYVRCNLPFRAGLRRIGVNIRYLGGKREQNNVFITPERLIKNMNPPSAKVMEKNNQILRSFSGYLMDNSTQFYFALIPTAAGVLQQDLPAYANVLNQRRLMESVYRELAGRAITTDIFTPLNTGQSYYLYYRTEDNLTAYGGYVVYAALASRMNITDSPSYHSFDIDYAKYDYYGDLYALAPFESIKPDIILQFKYSLHEREYIIEHHNGEKVKIYHSLYAEHLLDLNRTMDTYLGGISPLMHIDVSAPYQRNLLVLGDKTALAYLPFLVNHYSKVTFVDLSSPNDFLDTINTWEYDQVLMALSTETYCDSENLPVMQIDELIRD